MAFSFSGVYRCGILTCTDNVHLCRRTRLGELYRFRNAEVPKSVDQCTENGTCNPTSTGTGLAGKRESGAGGRQPKEPISKTQA